LLNIDVLLVFSLGAPGSYVFLTFSLSMMIGPAPSPVPTPHTGRSTVGFGSTRPTTVRPSLVSKAQGLLPRYQARPLGLIVGPYKGPRTYYCRSTVGLISSISTATSSVCRILPSGVGLPRYGVHRLPLLQVVRTTYHLDEYRYIAHTVLY